jgi:hypothetical protein
VVVLPAAALESMMAFRFGLNGGGTERRLE